MEDSLVLKFKACFKIRILRFSVFTSGCFTFTKPGTKQAFPLWRWAQDRSLDTACPPARCQGGQRAAAACPLLELHSPFPGRTPSVQRCSQPWSHAAAGQPRDTGCPFTFLAPLPAPTLARGQGTSFQSGPSHHFVSSFDAVLAVFFCSCPKVPALDCSRQHQGFSSVGFFILFLSIFSQKQTSCFPCSFKISQSLTFLELISFCCVMLYLVL